MIASPPSNHQVCTDRSAMTRSPRKFVFPLLQKNACSARVAIAPQPSGMFHADPHLYPLNRYHSLETGWGCSLKPKTESTHRLQLGGASLRDGKGDRAPSDKFYTTVRKTSIFWRSPPQYFLVRWTLTDIIDKLDTKLVGVQLIRFIKRVKREHYVDIAWATLICH